MKFFIILIICAMTVSPKEMSLLERLENKIYSFIHPVKELKFKNVPLKLDNFLASQIVKIAAQSPKRVPEPVETLDSLIKKYLVYLEGSSPVSLERMFNSLDQVSAKIMELDGTFISTADMKKCFVDDKTQCFLEMVEIQTKWNKIEKQIYNALRFKPSLIGSSIYGGNDFSTLRKETAKMRKYLKQGYLVMVELAKRGKTSDFGRFVQAKSAIQVALRKIIRRIGLITVYKKDAERVFASWRQNVEEQLSQASILREYLKREPTLKLSDIIYFFKEHVNKLKEMTKPKYEPKLPVIDELPELEGLEQAEIEDEEDLEGYERLISRGRTIRQIVKDQPIKKKKGFFGKLMSVLTFGCGGEE